MAKTIKYMGAADIARIKKGDNLGGRLSEGIPEDLVFNADNAFMVEVSDDDVADAILEDSERYKDVTGLKRIPSSTGQVLFGGHKKSADADAVLSEAGSTVSDGGTTTGGSTAGGGTAGGGAGKAGTGRGRST